MNKLFNYFLSIQAESTGLIGLGGMNRESLMKNHPKQMRKAPQSWKHSKVVETLSEYNNEHFSDTNSS